MDNYIPPCAASMGCLCAGHARGNPASDACDTSEVEAEVPDMNLAQAARVEIALRKGGQTVNSEEIVNAQVESLMEERERMLRALKMTDDEWGRKGWMY